MARGLRHAYSAGGVKALSRDPKSKAQVLGDSSTPWGDVKGSSTLRMDLAMFLDFCQRDSLAPVE